MNPDTESALDLGSTEVQRTLAQVWSDVLEIDSIGLDDNFFAMGGNSMLAVRAIVEAESRGVLTTLVDVLSNPTVRQLSKVASTAEDAPLALEPVAEVEPDEPRVCPASLLQQGLLFESELRPGAVYRDVVSHHVVLNFDEATLRSALDLLASRHDALRTSFDLTGYDEVMQVTENLVSIPVRVRIVTQGQDEINLDDDIAWAGRRFALGAAPLLRVAVSVTNNDSFWLTYGFHHAIMDGWSETVFATELLSAYNSLLAGADPQLPPSPGGMNELVRREREVLSSTEAQTYWVSVAESLPRVRPRPVGVETVHTTANVDPAVVADLLNGSARTGFPLKSFALAAYLLAWGQAQGSEEPVAGVVINARPAVPGAERMIGLFLNLIPLQCRIDDVRAPELVQRVFNAERDAIAVGCFPYPRMSELAGHPLFEGAVNFVEFEQRPKVWIGETRTVDSTSLPLLFDIVYEPVRNAMRVEASGNAELWTAEELEGIIRDWVAALTRLVEDGQGAPAAAREVDLHAAVSEAWQAVLLDRPPLEADSSFFRLGGTSIHAMRACAHLSRRLRRHIPVRMMFEHDGMERFARALSEAFETLPKVPRD